MMHLIEIFHIENQDVITMGTACSSCSSGCEPVTHSISETVKAFNSKYPEDGTIKRHEMKEDNLDAIAERLQEVYQNSGEGLIITSSNIKFILGKLSPVIAIDGKLVANNYIPDADELKFAIDTDKGIYNSICQ